MKIAIIGVSNLSKIAFILYLSKLISTNSKICVATKNKNLILLDNLNSFELDKIFITLNNQDVKSQETCLDEIKNNSEFDHIIYDIDYIIEDKDNFDCFDKYIFFSNSNAFEMKLNKKIINSIADKLNSDKKIEFINVYAEIVADSKINSKYLDLFYDLAFGKNIITNEKYTLYFNEIDRANIIENQHDEVISLKHLSREYKDVILEIYKSMFKVNKKESKKILKKAERM